MARLLPILAVALLLRLTVVLFALGEGRYFDRDSVTYDMLATNLLRLGTFARSAAPSAEPETFRTPGYPLFLAGIYALTTHGHAVALLVQVLLGTSLVYLVSQLGTFWWHARAGTIAAAFLASDFTSILNTSLLMSETLFTFLFLAVVALSVRWLRDGRAATLGLAGALAGMATLVRAVAFYWPVPFGALIVWRTIRSPARLAVPLLTFVLAYGTVVGPWIVRNHDWAGTWQIATVQSFNLLWYRAAGTIMRRDSIDLKEAQARLREIIHALRAEGRLDRASPFDIERTVALRIIMAHPLAFIESSLHGAGMILFGPGTATLSILLGQPSAPVRMGLLGLGMALLLVSYACALYGLGRGWRSRDRDGFIPVVLAVSYLLVVSAGPEAYSRFRVPIAPFVALLAGYGGHWLLERVRSNPCR